MAAHTIRVFESVDGPIIIPSGSCAAMIRHGYPELFKGEAEWLRRSEVIADRTYELTQFLVDHLRVTDFGAAYAGRIAYHPSCHLLRGLGVEAQPLSLLRRVQGSEVMQLEPDCCGFGGIFAVDQPEISTEMLRRRLTAIDSVRPTIIVGADISCLMQIEGGLRRAGSDLRCAHIAQILAGQDPGLGQKALA
jgi:L-lactate dehydrogenase complex protein LldE